MRFLDIKMREVKLNLHGVLCRVGLICLAPIARLPEGTSGLRGTAVASDWGSQKP